MPAPDLPTHVFVLMLENRSFDHLFGFSELTGTDAHTGQPTHIHGLTGQETNVYQGTAYPVTRGADPVMPADPGHEFEDVVTQLCGAGVRYAPPYPPIDSSGFIDSYMASDDAADPREIMKCFDTRTQLPVLFALAQSYALCDRWHASMPGPTVPNRLFVHGASSGGLDHSLGGAEVIARQGDGLALPHGTIFDALTRAGRHFRIYSGEGLPLVATLEGVSTLRIHDVNDLAHDLEAPDFAPDYVFIEPSYHALQGYRGGSSMHPRGDVRAGERLVKQVYEAVRSSPHWDDSLLVITWDEHGGFYDHVAPPPAVAPGDGGTASTLDKYGFPFERYGVRVPALVISPRIRRNTIDHRLYDHASIPRTLEDLFGLEPLTDRDAQAASLVDLLEGPATEGPGDHPPALPEPGAATMGADAVARPDGPIDDGSVPAFVHAALRRRLEADPAGRDRHLAEAAAIETRDDAHAFIAASGGHGA